MPVTLIGEELPEDNLPMLLKEAEERKKNKVPPGYKDDDKDGDKPYGDFFLWKQILLNSKHINKPMIFVTSERKEDWWEKKSGNTIGPRPELLREASEFCEQKILIYQTDRFLEFLSQRSGSVLNSDAVEEIRAIDLLRSDKENAVEFIAQKIIEGADEYLQEGMLTLNLKRSVRNLTGRGQFAPSMYSIPIINVRLISAPEDLGKYKLRAGTDTNSNFNLHVVSDVYQEFLPIGEYILGYKAHCDKKISTARTIKSLAEMVAVSPEILIRQLTKAGIEKTHELDEITDLEKLQLLEYMQSN